MSARRRRTKARRLKVVKGPDLIDRYEAALGAVGDRYDGLEDAVHALAALVTQRLALSVITHPTGPVTLGEHVTQLVEHIEHFATILASLGMMFEDEEAQA